MHIVRIIVWLVIAAALLLFAYANWQPLVTARIWPGLVVDSKLPVLMYGSLLAGLVPFWIYHRGVKWRLDRRIQSLEQAARYAAPPLHHHPCQPTATSQAAAPQAAETEPAQGSAQPCPPAVQQDQTT